MKVLYFFAASIVCVVLFGLTPAAKAATTTFGSSVDADADGLTDVAETQFTHTDPYKADTDSDGYSDPTEIYSGYNPLGPGRAPTSSKHVLVDLSTQTLTYFYNDLALGSFGVSTGLPIWRTPTGTFKVFAKKPVVNYTGANYSYPNTKWNLEFYPHVYLHGAYWHNQFGIRPMSHGCVNIAYKDVEGLYQYLDIGSQVKVIGKTPKIVPVEMRVVTASVSK